MKGSWRRPVLSKLKLPILVLGKKALAISIAMIILGLALAESLSVNGVSSGYLIVDPSMA